VPDEFLHDGVRVEDGRLAEAGADDLRRPPEEAIGVFLADLHAGAGLEQAHLLDDVEDEVGKVVDAVGALGRHAAGVDEGEVGIGAALGRGDADLRRRRLVVELDPEALEQLARLILRQ
jgi:hypothetical protein